MTLFFTESDNVTSYGYAIDKVYEVGQSKFQSYKVFETLKFGKMLVLDDVVMLTEKDEFVYHEMLAHIPALLSKSLDNVLVIGGGDGGTVRELLKHPNCGQITLCEIDAKVIELSKKYFPQVAIGFENPKVNELVADGIEFVKNSADKTYDLVIVDSSDPIGPGVGLFTEAFYADCKRLIKSGGCLAAQTESPWFEGSVIQKIYQNISKNFSYTKPYLGTVPTYPMGSWTWTVASEENLSLPSDLKKKISSLGVLNYLNADIAKACFALPEFYKKKLV